MSATPPSRCPRTEFPKGKTRGGDQEKSDKLAESEAKSQPATASLVAVAQFIASWPTC